MGLDLCCSKFKGQKTGHLKMADADLEAIRAKRMAELQAQYGVRPTTYRSNIQFIIDIFGDLQ